MSAFISLEQFDRCEGNSIGYGFFFFSLYLILTQNSETIRMLSLPSFCHVIIEYEVKSKGDEESKSCAIACSDSEDFDVLTNLFSMKTKQCGMKHSTQKYVDILRLQRYLLCESRLPR